MEAKKLVYVVEDDEDQLHLLRFLLAGAGYDVVTESHADKVMGTVRKLRPDIVLLDVMLPSNEGIDGFQLCGMIRDDPALERTRIIIVSAIAKGVNFDPEKLKRQTRADEYLQKPFEPAFLLERIKALTSM